MAQGTDHIPETTPTGVDADGRRLGLIGRDELLADVGALLTDLAVRLVTLTGPGGIGKTALARAVAASVGGAFPDGVVVAELAAERDPARLLAAVAQAAAMEPEGEETPSDTLIRGLAGRRLLLLDNLEQLLTGVAPLAALLDVCHGLTILATSRAPLALAGEREITVPPLNVPAAAGSPPPNVAAIPAVAVFLRRAGQANPAFSLTPANTATVMEICRRLDGLPLALELAGARLRLLSSESLLDRLDARLDVLTGGPRDAPERHRTIRDTVLWSVDLLGSGERRLFGYLAIFVGGCTLDDLAAVAAAVDAGRGRDAMDIAAAAGAEALLAAGLLQPATDANGGPRLTMLESVRDVAAEWLEAEGQTLATRRAHAARFLLVAEREGPRLRSDADTQLHVWNGIVADLGNHRAALAHLLAAEDVDRGLRLVAGLDWAWMDGSLLREGVDWIERFLAVAGPEPVVDRTVWGHAHRVLGLLHDWLGRGEAAERAATVALAALAESTDAGSLVEVLLVATTAALDRGDLPLARERGERLVRLIDSHSEVAGATSVDVLVGNAGLILAMVLTYQGDGDAAVARAEVAVGHVRRLGAVGALPTALQVLGAAQMVAGDLDAATVVLRGAVDASRASAEAGAGDFIHSIFTTVAELAQRRGDAEVAAQLYAAGEAEGMLTGIPLRPPMQARIDAGAAALRTELGDSRFAAAWAAGAATPRAERIALAETYLHERVAPEMSETFTTLSRRELEVLRLIVAGCSDQEIGERLFIARKTASRHVSNLLGKLGQPSRTAAAAYARAHGLAV